MRRFTSVLILLLSLALFPAPPAAAWLFGSNDTLVSIDGDRYNKDDFKRWWKFWKEGDDPLPKTPDPYIDFLLLAREGERMELDETPSFQRATRVFIQSRALLMLKQDAVDSQIKITDEDMKAYYEEKYLPRWLVQRLEFGSDEAALKAWQELSDKTLTVDELLTREPGQGGPQSRGENWLRPSSIDPGWAEIFKKLAVGGVVNPEEHGEGPTLYHLKEIKGGDEEDFAKLKEEIKQDFWKAKEDELTLSLLQDLKKKYQVEIDKERLAALEINAADETLTDAVVISSSQQNVTEKQFMAVVRRLMDSRPYAAHAANDEEQATSLKEETVNNILAQSLTNWEALDRHYEEKEPFKWEYQFNRNHRLILALEELILLPEARATEEEIKQHYEENIERYSQPTLVKIRIIDDTQGPIDQVWADVVVGTKFTDAVSKYFERSYPVQEVPANHLDPEFKTVVDKLAVGETSPIFTAEGKRVIVHLVERTPSYPLPLERVKESIRSRIVKEKMEKARKDYLDRIKSSSQIEVRKRPWKAIQKELGGA
jgi:hypothetical protein